jgi:phosphoribosylformylglycinamidine (FGAM) synthase PurS component
MTKIKLYVKLKIPDTTAITAFHTLERMGYKQLKNLEREDYYEFIVLKDVDKFMEDIVNVDILVNANKHDSNITKEGEPIDHEDSVNVLVKDSGNNSAGLMSTLMGRMGFSDIAEISKGVLWKMNIDADSDEAKKIAEKITKELLYNENYQEFEIL